MIEQPASRQTQVAEQAEKLARAIEGIFKEIEILSGRLTVISNNQPQPTTSNKNQTERTLCEHAEFLRKQVSEVVRASERISELTARLEI